MIDNNDFVNAKSPSGIVICLVIEFSEAEKSNLVDENKGDEIVILNHKILAWLKLGRPRLGSDKYKRLLRW